MHSLFKVIFKLRLEEFLAFILLAPMLFFMVIYYGEEGFRESNVDRFLITGGVFNHFFIFVSIHYCSRQKKVCPFFINTIVYSIANISLPN